MPDVIIIGAGVAGTSIAYHACGFSGHGFMHAPAVGRLMADVILGKEGALSEVTPFRLERFQHPVEMQETAFI